VGIAIKKINKEGDEITKQVISRNGSKVSGGEMKKKKIQKKRKI